MDIALNVFLVPGVRVEIPATETTCSFALNHSEDIGQETCVRNNPRRAFPGYLALLLGVGCEAVGVFTL